MVGKTELPNLIVAIGLEEGKIQIQINCTSLYNGPCVTSYLWWSGWMNICIQLWTALVTFHFWVDFMCVHNRQQVCVQSPDVSRKLEHSLYWLELLFVYWKIFVRLKVCDCWEPDCQSVKLYISGLNETTHFTGCGWWFINGKYNLKNPCHIFFLWDSFKWTSNNDKYE